MKFLYTYIPFQILLGVVLGVLLPLPNTTFLVAVFFFFCLLFVTTLLLNNPRFKNWAILCIVVLFGVLLSWQSLFLSTPKNIKNHYLNHDNSQGVFRLLVTKKIKSSPTKHRFYARLKSINHQKTSGLVLLEINKDSLKSARINTGDELQAYAKISAINSAISPYDFDYKKYLARKNIHGKVILKRYSFLKSHFSLLYTIQNYRSNVVEKITQNPYLSDAVKGLMCAMLFGDKDHLSKSLQTSFTNAGVVHILAISGMHVGVLYLMLFYLFGFFKFFKNGTYFQVLAVVVCLLIFAVFSGLSTSVVRSVVMFSFVALARLKRKSGLLLEPIVSSALVLLVFNPKYLFDVGFLLSYFAVISIVVFYPLLSDLFRMKNKILKYFVDVFIVSIIAQLGVLAISLYYFHQFSFQFLPANFFAVTLLPLVLYASILCCFKIMFFSGAPFVEQCYNAVIELYLKGIAYWGNQKGFIVEDISISVIHIVLYYLLIWGVWSCLVKRHVLKYIAILSLVLLFQIYHLCNSYFVFNKKELIVYNTYLLTISEKRKHKLQVYGEVKKDIKLNANRIKSKIKSVSINQNKVFKFRNRVFLIIDKSLEYQHLKVEDDLVLILNNHPKINLERLLLSLKPKEVIVASNNYFDHIEKWKSTCRKLQVPCYDVKQKGYYLIP